MPIVAEIFRVNDIRGLLSQVTVEVARAAGAALVRKTGAKVVVVGRDMRSTSPDLQAAAVDGITSMGADVIDIGMCTTSMYNFAVTSQASVGAGLMVTASHNPPEYNGIKMATADGMPIPGAEMYEPSLESWEPVAQRGSVKTMNILDEYINACISRADLPNVRGVRVLADFGNGMGALSLRPLCAKLGIELVEMYEEPDARFPNHEANPAKHETLNDVCARLKQESFDFGVALDGDADRIAFIDNEGEYLRGDQGLTVLARDLLGRHAGAKIVVAPNQGWVTTDTIERLGGELVWCAIGRTKAIKALRDSGAPLGGELSSHFFFEEFHGLEAVDFAFLKVLGAWKRSDVSFADFVRDLRVGANSGEVNVEVEDKIDALARLKVRFAPTATVVNELDGIRCEFERDWWFIVRPSNTEPLIRVIVEATTHELMEEKRDEIVALLTR